MQFVRWVPTVWSNLLGNSTEITTLWQTMLRENHKPNTLVNYEIFNDAISNVWRHKFLVGKMSK
jgi:hypothetical protein